MKWFNSFKNESTSYISLVSLMLMFLIAGIFHYVFYNTEMDFQEKRIAEIQNAKNTFSWQIIESAIKTSVYDAELNAKGVAGSIVSDIHDNYDLAKLKEELDNKSIANTDLVGLIYKNIKGKTLYNTNSPKNNLIVISKSGFIIDTITSNKTKMAITMDSAIANDYNPVLAEEAYKLMIDKQVPDGFVFYEPRFIDNDTHTKITHPLLSEMREIFLKEGLRGLSGYVVLVPVYITNDGDIFGTPDVDKDGTVIKNHKLIVVQCFSVTNVLGKHNLNELNTINETTKHMEQEVRHGMALRTLSYIAIMLLNIFALLLLLYFVNQLKKQPE